MKETVLKRLGALDKYNMGDFLKHIDEEDGYLIDRVLTEHKKLATTFRGIEEGKLINFILKCLTREDVVSAVFQWLNDYSQGNIATFSFNCSTVLGYGFFKEAWHNWNEGAVPCHKLTICLKRTDDEARGFVVASVYPSVNAVDMNYVAKRHSDLMNLKAM